MGIEMNNKIGDWIVFSGKVGRIIDIAKSETKRTMLLVESPEMIWRNHRPEWIEYKDGMVSPASKEQVSSAFGIAAEHLKRMHQKLNAMM